MLTHWNAAKVVVTGGAGLIGSHVVRRLLDLGAHLTVIDNFDPRYGGNCFNLEPSAPRLKLIIGNLRDLTVVTDALRGATHLFHLAAQTSHSDSMSDPLNDLAENAANTLGILEACRKTAPEVRVVFASTRQVYGRADYLPVNEDHPTKLPDINAIHKLAAEHYFRLYSEIYGIRSTVLRLTNVFGPGMRICDARQTFLGVWVRNLLTQQPISIFGDGKQLRDLTYVEDCAQAIIAASGIEDEAGLFNVGGCKPVDLLTLAKLMISIRGSGSFELVPFPSDRNAIDIGDFYADDSAFRTATGWSAETSLEEGVARTLRFYQANLSHYLRTE